MALGSTTSPISKVGSAIAGTERFSENAPRGRSRRGSLPFNAAAELITARPGRSWLIRRFASILRRSPTETEDLDAVKNRRNHESHECCTKCRQAFDDTVQLWTNEDECSVDPSNLYRQQLRVILQQETNSEFSETDLAQLTRSLSEGDIGRAGEDNDNEYFDDLIDRYGLMSGDYVETLCVPEGAVIGDDECYITGAFLDNLDQSSTKSTPTQSIEQSPPVVFRGATSDEQRRANSLNCEDFKAQETDVTEPVSRTRTFPQRKRNKRVSMLLFDTLARRLSRANVTDFKWRREPMKNIIERALWSANEGLPDHLSSALSAPSEYDVESVNFDTSDTAKYHL
ncbi:hypothetical protein ANCCAN_17131 [Ancylostoma caninum]|uniref:Uncharacterized protein n=1 Tax=Ancylostoma caninum TaxID=29170 RepID=A0A368G1Z5_ANCCA|nr:hypothetical protein ANCCAN_17131 [Ancylostoma caninum]